ncbi:acetyl/propionyl/methylcrotonyl-CoA carboxylase subunit alpha [Stenotrophomonas sp. MMGLT7]|uniref:acetyl/propionyl/methylcrotonyl-CoA carboxylase subunit alpha n=1 Tax=Stenotrophomonas sp. MMGLT7 TaxID=2901227 RepID=UPI001E54E3A2|nr:acetyl/propionyl/methylcrotonyl-CoA carboxylase subunit alpha [Stenotrophomonas sp. MMGLT7]MCD7099623.1 acetyl/propionyl/methylcrotonyl-CoA carboxylase subunit alpha [Stenotrophomonas sp. MMGLT7]
MATSPSPMFDKILIANRGEIACRVIATCRRLGIASVAVYSDADRDARHVRLADEAVRIGPAPARESYLRGDALLAAAHATGAQAIHPGYGFLSENADFAEACSAAGIVFIGPPPAAIRAMGDKSAAKALMQRAGVPLTPGYHGDTQDPAFLREQADAIGYPVLIKASAGGGGKGMRKVEAADGFEAALAGCRREAQGAFGNAHVLVEKYVERPRHIEIQVFGDSHGNLVHLFERDCSVQRRHQKVLEEAPAPGMTGERRAAMGRAAVEAARAVGYVGAGTVEFIVSPQGEFWFMEMNTRLQVEHPVTEMITGTDLVEWQLRVAAGQPLPLRQEQLAIRGHAIEARLYAENPDNGFLPSTGVLRHLRFPDMDAHVRVDAGVDAGDAMTAHYDPMIAKLVAWGADRDDALRRLRQALDRCRLVGVSSNAGFLRRLLDTASFSQAHLDTALIEREHEALSAPAAAGDAQWMMAALALLQAAAAATAGPADPHSPWDIQDSWRMTGPAARRLWLECDGRRRLVAATPRGDRDWLLALDDAAALPAALSHEGTRLRLRLGDRQYRAEAILDGDTVHIFEAGRSQAFSLHDPVAEADQPPGQDGGLAAPMPGRIVALLAGIGVKLARGTPLLVLEAMKMEHTLQAPADGIVRSFRVREGELVAEGAALVEFEPAEMP